MPHVENEPRWDAQTLAEAKVIAASPDRLAAAEGAASELAKEKEKDAAAMASVAGSNIKARAIYPNSPELFGGDNGTANNA